MPFCQHKRACLRAEQPDVDGRLCQGHSRLSTRPALQVRLMHRSAVSYWFFLNPGYQQYVVCRLAIATLLEQDSSVCAKHLGANRRETQRAHLANAAGTLASRPPRATAAATCAPPAAAAVTAAAATALRRRRLMSAPRPAACWQPWRRCPPPTNALHSSSSSTAGAP